MSLSPILPVAEHSFGRANCYLNCLVLGTDTYKRRARICNNAPICALQVSSYICYNDITFALIYLQTWLCLFVM